MILIVSPYAGAMDIAHAIGQATDLGVETAHSSQEAATALRAREFTAVVFDQLLLDAEPEEAELLLDHMGVATPIYVNFAIHKRDRVVGQVRGAMRRREVEQCSARVSVRRALRSEFNETATAILLSCELALSDAQMPTAALDRLHTVHALATDLCARLIETT